MPPRPGLRQVPSIAQVVPGAFVHIVLKQDQPTGRTVQGVVQNVLTRGNHPRGIKVRLSDGRVGRVQTMGDSKASPSSLSMPAGPASEGAASYVARETDSDDLPRDQIGLDAFIKPAKSKQNRRRGHNSSAAAPASDESPAPETTATTATTTCPVCGDFEGDEAAVSHHVASHFDS